jgi:hypothetical protein
MSFKKFYYLKEGGNVRAINRETGEIVASAEKMDLRKIDRQYIIDRMLNTFYALNKMFKSKHDIPIWVDESILKSGQAFNGSSEAFFNQKISDEQFIKHKPSVGDVDLTIPHEHLPELFEMLKGLEGQDIVKGVKYIGQGKQNLGHGHQINGIFQITQGKETVMSQVDFEGVDYDTDRTNPTPWAKFSHNSHWDDIVEGFKGVHHKYMLMNLTRSLSTREDIVVLTPKSPTEPPEKVKVKRVKGKEIPTSLAFSVDRGIRSKFVPAYNSAGEQIEVEGKLAFKELPTADSKYEKNLEGVFELLFNVKPTPAELEKLNSFIGLLQLTKQYAQPQQIKLCFKHLMEKSLFGPGAQGLERNNPELDFAIKDKMVSEMTRVFPMLKKDYVAYQPMIEEYYKTYKMVGEQ